MYFNLVCKGMPVNSKSERIASIDVLRGIAIFGMVLCAQIGWNSGLPAWMFHAQTPPPDYAFNPEVRGLTWVDLVFPFFLFSMGAALPFSLGKKLSKGESRWKIIAGLFKRFFILLAFSFVLGNSYHIYAADISRVWLNLIMIAIWGALFLSLGRFGFKNEKVNNALNLSGVLLLAGFGVLAHFLPGGGLSKEYSDIIIMILAYLSFSGGLIWLLTDKSHIARWAVFGGIFAIKALASYLPWSFAFMPSIDGIRWIFDWGFLQYLLIVIPASVVGDMILQRKNEPVRKSLPNNCAVGACVFAVVIQLWALSAREAVADAAVVACVLSSVICLTYKSRALWSDIASLGLILLLAGIVFDPIDGGIRKDYCNISYLLVTGGMAMIATGVLLYFEKAFGLRFKALSQCGQNPMLAYTVTGFIISPLLELVCILPLIDSLAEGSPLMGLLRGLFITFLMMVLTVFFTRKKLFWRS